MAVFPFSADYTIGRVFARVMLFGDGICGRVDGGKWCG